jgi:hypothetical protein
MKQKQDTANQLFASVLGHHPIIALADFAALLRFEELHPNLFHRNRTMPSAAALAARADDFACSARLKASRALALVNEKNCSGSLCVVGNETDMTCILPSCATAAETQPAMGTTLCAAVDERSPPTALLMALSSVLPNANRLLPIVI